MAGSEASPSPDGERPRSIRTPNRCAGGQARQQGRQGDGQRAAACHREAEEVLDAERDEARQQRDGQQSIVRRSQGVARRDHHAGDQHDDGESRPSSPWVAGC